MAKLNEQDILERLKDARTKRRAFEDIVNCFSRQLYWQIHYLLQNHEDTDDVLQNTFIKAWKGIDGFKGDSALGTWLYRIAYNESLTFLKQRRQMVSIDDEDFTGQATFVADEDFDGDETEQVLMQAVSTLPAKQRQVFCMKYFEEKKYEEISELVGTSVGALKASYHIAVEKITNFVKAKES
ncbi:MAG: sigma-70 family RNA polymerase sigma factor [Bacteroidaceae bacterium]|nr:sigma-70 family RNA polymerase sigma factor [Bacteroidaceae bacterium]MBR1521726.1 sigma-70 family RNA polymerase sigma factor [Bacteroidaceae bacterium]